MNIATAIRKGIYTFLIPTSGTNSFKTAVQLLLSGSTYGYKLFHYQAPQFYPGTSVSVVPSYVTFSLLPITGTRDTVNKFYECLLQFNVCALTEEAAENLTQLIYDKLEDSESTLTFTGYKTIRIERAPQLPIFKLDNVFNRVAQYNLQLQAN